MGIVRDVVNHWKSDWRENRTMFWFEFLGTMFSITATAVLSFWADVPPMVLCYTLWLIGSSLMTIGAKMRRASWMFLLMAFNTVLNIVGLYVLVLR